MNITFLGLEMYVVQAGCLRFQRHSSWRYQVQRMVLAKTCHSRFNCDP